MNKIMTAVAISLIILFSGSLAYVVISSDTYDDVQKKIVETLCLSCIKLKPLYKKEYRFLNDDNHPDFILENLSNGPVLLDYRITFCPGCNHLEENILSFVLNYSYPSDELFYFHKEFKNTKLNFIHITTDVFPKGSEYEQSRHVYDFIGDEANPMLVFITYGYNHGFIEPMYLTLYDVGSGDYINDKQNVRKELNEFIIESVDLYNEYKDASK